MAGNYVLLDRIELNASAASVTFSSIPQTGYTDLKIVMSARDSSSAGANYNGYSFTIYPNGLSTNITQKSLFGNGGGASSYSDTQMYKVIDMSADTANTFSNVEIYVPNYTSSNYKSFSIDGVAEANATNSAMRLAAGLWSSTAAITSLQFNAYSTFTVGSTFSLYGLAAVGTTPAIAPKADGGNVIATDGTYWYHAFLANGTFTPQVGLSADVLVVAGGGGGGSYAGGGGGAGGYLTFTSQSLANATTYTCTVGAGGTAGAGGGGNGYNGGAGNNSQFGALTSAIGGGFGGGGNAPGVIVAGSTGGSGGGSSASATGTTAGGSGTSGQGNNGGYGNTDNVSFRYGGAGGGASAVGGNAATASSAIGGAGSTTSISGGAATGLGQLSSGSYYFAGGGGGGASQSHAGGVGGGGSSGVYNGVAAVAGTTNTGGGGGGHDYNSPGGAGGSGIIIIRYAV